MSRYTIQGRDVSIPVAVRDASQWAAQFLVPAEAAQAVIDGTGLQVARPFPGRAMVALSFVDYRDTDLDAYHEVAVGFVVREHSVVREHDAPPVAGERELLPERAPIGARSRRQSVGFGRRSLPRKPERAPGQSNWDLLREFWTGRVGAYIHRLPVDQAFTLEAGVSIWGFPKFMAEIELREVGGYTVCELAHDGEHVLTLGVRNGGALRLPERTPPAYSFHDGVLRRTEWEQHGEGRGGRLGGAELTLGTHPVAKELASLGLPKRALMSSSTRHMQATFQAAVSV